MTSHSQAEILERIASALHAARTIFQRFTPGEIETEYKSGHDPVTEADKAVDTALRERLLRDDEGWLSEESVDDFTRLQKTRVWVVDPLDGTREFVAGIPEFCVSIAMVEDGRPVAGGIYNPATEEIFLGSLDRGMTYNGEPARASQRKDMEGAVILASRSETARGDWKQFEKAPFKSRLMGSVAYKLALVSAGLADATFTLTPKHEWDVAAGAALVESAGGIVRTLNDEPLLGNRRSPKLSGLVATGPLLYNQLRTLLGTHIPAASLRPRLR
jgi:myo-inositol-1(or 4)-monophosphatase